MTVGVKVGVTEVVGDKVGVTDGVGEGGGWHSDFVDVNSVFVKLKGTQVVVQINVIIDGDDDTVVKHKYGMEFGRVAPTSNLADVVSD